MKVLIMPDSFKGSVDALNAAKSIERGILNTNVAIETTLLPMADGGEGTMHTLVNATKGFICEVESVDPLGRTLNAQYGITGDGKTAIIELASSSGIDLLTQKEKNPYITSTYGTGLLIKDALENGIKHFIVCLGGSATNDAGVGLLSALGYQFLDEDDKVITQGGIYLSGISSIDETNVLPQIKDASFEIACDVTNPFVGNEGASYIFGPQKGADSEMVQSLDKSLNHFAHIIEKEKGVSIHQLPGAGAAGGTAGGMLAFLNSKLKNGIDLVFDYVDVKSRLDYQRFDYIVTGEGKLDGQTLGGKVISGVCKLGKEYHIPVIAICGVVEGDLQPLHDQGLTAAFSITNGPMSFQESIENGQHLIERQASQIFHLLEHK